jgi:alpha-L-rhamnosidase
LEVGLHRKDSSDGSWTESTTELTIQPTGGAIGQNGQHRLYLPGSLYNDALQCTTSDGKTITTRPIGLALFDGQKSALIAELRDRHVGHLLPSGDKVIYRNICTDLKCDLVVEYKKGGYESSVIIRERFDPSEWGFTNAATVRVQWLTEFFGSPPESMVEAPPLNGLSDAEIDFGELQMGEGKAFLLNDSAVSETRVYKRWLVLPDSGRTVLVEEIPWPSMAAEVLKLPPHTAALRPAAPGLATSQQASLERILPSARPAGHCTNAVELARLDDPESPGYLADYELHGSLRNFVFKGEGDGTYVLTAPKAVTLRGTAIIEGNAVIKFANHPGTQLRLKGPLVCQTGPGRMAILTSVDDNSVGAVIGSGTPTNFNGATYLCTKAFRDAPYTNSFRYVRFAYAGLALDLTGDTKADVWHCQFVSCDMGIRLYEDCNGVFGGVHNALFAQCGLVESSGSSFNGEHLTVDGGGLFGSSAGRGNFTNSIFTGVTNLESSFFDHCLTNSSSAGFFQSAGAGNYYLAPFSPYRLAGSANIHPTLRSDLKQKTTYPPFVYSNITVRTNMTLAPQAQRESAFAPDIGFAYDPLDYITYILAVTNANLTVAPGTAIACYNDTGIWLREGSSITSVGTPTAPIRFVRYQSVQEQPLPLGRFPPHSGFGINPYHIGTPEPVGKFRFSRFTCPANGGSHFYDGNWNFGGLQLQDSEIWGGLNRMAGDSFNSSGLLKNNLFHRGQLLLSGTVDNYYSVSNNLFWSLSSLSIRPVNPDLWSVYDNLFDSCDFSGRSGPLANSGYNAYWECHRGVDRKNPSDITLTNAIAYQSGPLGDFYQADTSPLINAGSCTADLSGLFHYTVLTNTSDGAEIPETNSIVDMGLHYVAVDTNSLPLDSDGGGAPNWMENAAGDGHTNNVGEGNWQDASDDVNELMRPGYLRCEYRVDPWGVNAEDPLTGKQKPRLFWVLTSGHRAAKQLAYQVLVATDINNLALGVGDMWDSGQILSDQTIHIEYSGYPLQSGQRLWWKVRSWDRTTGLASPWSTNGFFQMGLLSTNDWSVVKWIGVINYSHGQPCPMFRKTFLLTNQVQSATAYTSAKGVYELWVNGHKIGPNVLAPEWTDYHKRIQYQTFDLGPYLTNGTATSTNVIAAVVAEGWFSGSGQVGNGACSDIGAPNPQFALLLTVTNTDGSATNIATDATWTGFTNGAIRSASISANLSSGEKTDARLEGFHTNWTTATYTNAALFRSGYLTNYNVTATQMFAQPSEPIQSTKTNFSVAVWTLSNDGATVKKIFDTGELISGVCSLTLKTGGTNAGAQVTLEQAEVLELGTDNSSPNGPSTSDIYTVNLNGSSQLETDILNGDLVQTFRPHFTYHAFRFVRVTAPAALAGELTTSALVAIATHSAVPATGAFVCYDTNFANTNVTAMLTNNPVSRLMTNISRTIVNNLQGVFTSCGGRNEREGYFYDEHIVSQTACFDVDLAAFLTKWIRDMRDAQLASGQYSIYAPDAVLYWPPDFADPGAEAGGLIFPWRLYQNYADTRMLREHYASASNWLRYASNQFPDYIWHRVDSGGHGQYNIIDWMHAEWFSLFGDHPAGWSPGGFYGGMEATNWGTAWYAYSADTLAAMADALQGESILRGDIAGARTYYSQYANYKALAAAVRSAYANLANDPNQWIKYDQNQNINGLFHNTQADCLCALYFNMVPENQRSNILHILLKGPVGIENFNSFYGSSYDLSTGYFFSSRAMLELTRNGYTSIAYRLLMDASFPAWLYPVFNGFTTCWEGWNTYISGAGSDKGYYPAKHLSSFNHLPFGAVGEWIWEVVGGINPDDSNPGFRNVIVKPQPGGGITNAFASFDSIRGKIISSWTNDAATTNFSLDIMVPANVTASVYMVGATNLGTITESGSYATNASGLLTPPRVLNGAAVFQVGSGQYKFKAPIRF